MKRFAKMQSLLLCVLVLFVGCGSGTSNQSNSSAPAGSAAQSSAPAGSAQAPATAASAAPGPAASAPAPAPAAPPSIEIPAGTSIVVTADESVSSKTANPGDRFAASLAAPVTINGQQVIPSGTKASGRVLDAKSAGKLKGNAELSVTLSSIEVNGQRYDVKASSYVEVGKARGKRTAIGAGGGAALGAIVGALAGHGKGAAIGAAAGAGAGTAGAAYTGDTEVTIPAETRLRFRLTQPLQVPGQ